MALSRENKAQWAEKLFRLILADGQVWDITELTRLVGDMVGVSDGVAYVYLIFRLNKDVIMGERDGRDRVWFRHYDLFNPVEDVMSAKATVTAMDPEELIGWVSRVGKIDPDEAWAVYHRLIHSGELSSSSTVVPRRN